MHIKSDIVLIFLILLVLISVVYYVGFVSDTLVGAKVVQQLGFFLTGRKSNGGYGYSTIQGATNAASNPFPFINPPNPFQ